ncbi:STAS-like domain-containing protein [Oxalobacteraceae sp. CFBP 13730]|nr:STAS-like domain-containing protein [Oxalobacteraceae sp. CFBP 13730]
MEIMNVSIAKQFSETPSGRYVEDGPASGQRFREEFLVPALQSGKSVAVDLDGAVGFGSSFLEEAFGGLVRVAGFRAPDLRARLTVLSGLKTYRDRVWRYIDEAQARVPARG